MSDQVVSQIYLKIPLLSQTRAANGMIPVMKSLKKKKIVQLFNGPIFFTLNETYIRWKQVKSLVVFMYVYFWIVLVLLYCIATFWCCQLHGISTMSQNRSSIKIYNVKRHQLWEEILWYLCSASNYRKKMYSPDEMNVDQRVVLVQSEVCRLVVDHRHVDVVLHVKIVSDFLLEKFNLIICFAISETTFCEILSLWQTF